MQFGTLHRAAVLVLAALALSITAAPASATVRADFLAAARQAWPESPCAGREQITVAPLEDAHDDHGAQYHLSGLAYPEQCAVTIDAAIANELLGCYVLAHELGHLATGEWHSTDPYSLMWTATRAHPDARWLAYTESTYTPCEQAAHPLTLRGARGAVRAYISADRGTPQVACRWRERGLTARCRARWLEWHGRWRRLRDTFDVHFEPHGLKRVERPFEVWTAG